MTDPAKTHTASVAYVRALFDYVEGMGTSVATLLEGVTVDLEDRDARLSEVECAALFDRAAALLGDDAIGLHAGERIRPGHYGVLGYMVMNCATLADALGQLQRYQTLVIDIGPPEFSRHDGALTVTWNPRLERPLRQLAEFNLSAMLAFARWISGRDDVPQRVDFTFPAPARLEEHRRIFRCALRWGEPVYRIVLPSRWLDAPLIRPDPEVRAAMRALADKQLLSRASERQGGELDGVRELVAKNLSAGDAALAKIAAGLGMSARTLQRKLQERGQSFSAIVDDVRRELAIRHLGDDALDLNDLAFLLGFSEQSAFQRAFKRWTGEAPGAYRKRRQGTFS